MSVNANSFSEEIFDVYFGNSHSRFNAIKISIFSSEEIIKQSYGKVVSGETINYRTNNPENGGLFCAKIFGSMKNFECICGKYRGIKYKNIVCEKCGVEVTSTRVRRQRMGHIELADPVAHIWFLKSLPSRICQILDLTMKSVERVLYFESYAVLDPGITTLQKGEIINEEKYASCIKEFGEGSFEAGMGAETIKKMLSEVDLEKLRDDLYVQINSGLSEMKHKKFVRRLRLVNEFIKSGNKPEHMILDVIPVIPSNLRPLVMLEGGRFASSDLNSLYRTVINRNNRLKNLKLLNAPTIVINNEKRMLQEAVDALFDNSRRTKVIKGYNKRPYKSLSDMLKGKQGRFRLNLLGKRVDYSGRSVIVVGPKLKLNQCGLPKKIALELFKPFIYAKLSLYGIAATFKIANRMVQNERPEVWDILDEVIKEHPVLLNRAPTLHRISIQAFEPMLIEGKAIQLHPLVCTAFNADFDGDQMAVHVPLSIEAQVEARMLMMSDRNILNPANGKPTIVPSKDIVLGIYYLTQKEKNHVDSYEMYHLSGVNEVEKSLYAKYITLHTPIKCRIDILDPITNKYNKKWFSTTAGRIKLFSILPDNMNFELINKVLDVKKMTDLVSEVYRKCGRETTVKFCDDLMRLGFEYATISGISFGKNDMIVTSSKNKHITETDEQVKQYESQYQDGLITKSEKYNKVVDAWQDCTDVVAVDMMKQISKYDVVRNMNAIYMMADSGARGSPAQIRQLAGMRGLMAKPSGEIMDTPIKSNLREGQTVMEYFISTHGARKGLADTALKTANSGYLTRRLVDVAQDSIITQYDCNTLEGLMMRSVIDNGNIIVSLAESIIGRCSAIDIIDPNTGKVTIKSGELILEDQIKIIESIGIDAIQIRSALTCDVVEGLCAKCYGVDLSKGNELVSIGESVGVVAAQSVGEPGTQLTMRTFHVGGAATKRIEVSSLNSFCTGKVVMSVNTNIISNRKGEKIVVSRSLDIKIVDHSGTEHSHGRVPYGATIYVVDGQEIKIGTKIANWDPYNAHIINEYKGKVVYKDLIDNISLNEQLDTDTGIINKTIIETRKSDQNTGIKLRPRIEIVDDNDQVLTCSKKGTKAIYPLVVGSVLNVDNNSLVEPGDLLVKISKMSNTTRDITGGLPKVAELFEARNPKDSAIISDIDGYVEFGKDNYKNKRRIIVKSEDGINEVDYLIPKSNHIIVAEGDYIKKGDLIVDGIQNPHDILRILGIRALADYMISEIQHVYRLQGVKINNKHFEVIVRKMLQKVEVVDAGDSSFLTGEIIDTIDVNYVNKNLEKEGKKKIIFRPVLLGITKASLQTRSFISAASFQETTKVLTEAAVSGKVDYLTGLKENVIVGRLLPTGTGLVVYRMLENMKKNKVTSSMKDDSIEDKLASIYESKTFLGSNDHIS